MSLKSITFHGIKWSLASQLLRQGVQLATTMLLSRLLTPADFGLIGMAAILVGFAQLFGDVGFSTALIQRKELREDHIHSIFWLTTAIGLLLTLLVLASAPLVAWFYHEPQVGPIVAVLAVTFLFNGMGSVPTAMLTRNMEFKKLAAIDVGTTALQSLLALGAVLWLHAGMWSLVIQMVGGSAIQTALTWLLCRWRVKSLFRLAACRELARFSLNLFGFQMLNYWSRNADNFLVGRYIGAQGLGIYARAYSLMMLPLSRITWTISGVLQPALSRLQDDPARFRQSFLRLIRLLALLTFPLMMFLWVAAEPVVLLTCGKQWLEMVPVFRVLCITGLMQSVSSAAGLVFNCMGRTDLTFRWGIYSSVMTLLSFIIGLQWGIMGVACAYTLCNIIFLWWPLWHFSGRIISLPFMVIMRNIAGPFCLSFLMALLLQGVCKCWPPGFPYWIQLLILSVVALPVYLISLHIVRLKAYVDLRDLMQESAVGRRINRWLPSCA